MRNLKRHLAAAGPQPGARSRSDSLSNLARDCMTTAKDVAVPAGGRRQHVAYNTGVQPAVLALVTQLKLRQQLLDPRDILPHIGDEDDDASTTIGHAKTGDAGSWVTVLVLVKTSLKGKPRSHT